MYIYKRLSTDVGNGLVQKVTQPCNDWKNHPAFMIQPNLPEHMCAPCAGEGECTLLAQQFHFAIHYIR